MNGDHLFTRFNERYIAEWYKCKTGEAIHQIFRQKKEVLRLIYASLPNMPPVDDVTRDVLVDRLKRYVFSEDEREEMRKFRELKDKLNSHRARRRSTSDHTLSSINGESTVSSKTNKRFRKNAEDSTCRCKSSIPLRPQRPHGVLAKLFAAPRQR